MGWAKYYEDNLELALSREPLITELDAMRYAVKGRQVHNEILIEEHNASDKAIPPSIDPLETVVQVEITSSHNKYKTRELCCQDCGRFFLFSSKAQEVFDGNGWKPPKRCKTCRDNRTIKYLMRAS